MNFCAAILLLKMEENAQNLGGIVLYYLKKGRNATETHTEKTCAVYGQSAVTDRMHQKWCAKFRARDFSLGNAP